MKKAPVVRFLKKEANKNLCEGNVVVTCIMHYLMRGDIHTEGCFDTTREGHEAQRCNNGLE
jgi:hypothetical protein